MGKYAIYELRSIRKHKIGIITNISLPFNKHYDIIRII